MLFTADIQQSTQGHSFETPVSQNCKTVSQTQFK